MFIFLKIHKYLSQYLPHKQRQAIIEAFFIASDDHLESSSLEAKVNWLQLVDTVSRLSEIKFDAEYIIAFLLYKAIRKGFLSYHMIRHRYDGQVSKIVDQLIAIENIILKEKHNINDILYNTIIFTNDDFGALIIQIIERVVLMSYLHKSTNLQNISIVAHQTLDIYAPLAHKLGMTELKQQLEKSAFQILYPYRYNIIIKEIDRIKENKRFIFDSVFAMLDKHLQELLTSSFRIIGRTKTPYSVYIKLKQESLSIDNINDIYAYTIIANNKNECYVILGIIHSLFKPVHKLFKDFIAAPKENGYQSIHTTLLGPYEIPIEVQIKTEDMYLVSKYGLSAHWLYKEHKKYIFDKKNISQKNVYSNSTMSKEESDADNNSQLLSSIDNKEITILTPLGMIVKMPVNSTCIDLAYAIHSNIGHSCIAAYVNRRRVSLKYKICNGDMVEIITKQGSYPKQEWLEFATTERAISQIISSLKKPIM